MTTLDILKVWAVCTIDLSQSLTSGVIQQLRGQEEGEKSAKSPLMSTRGALNVHVDQNPAISERISYHCAL